MTKALSAGIRRVGVWATRSTTTGMAAHLLPREATFMSLSVPAMTGRVWLESQCSMTLMTL